MKQANPPLNRLRRAWKSFLGLFDDAPSDEPVYDPVDLAGVIVGCLTGAGVLYWLLWSLLVCEGGIFTKIGPFLQVVFTAKTLQDFGYEGYPYQLGIFEGWIVNLAALVISLALLVGIWYLFQPNDKKEGKR